MEDIYDESATDEYVDGVVGGVLLGKFLSDTSDSTYRFDGADDNGLYPNNEETLEKMAPPKKGLGGLITAFVRIETFVIAVASIVMLIVCGVINGFNL